MIVSPLHLPTAADWSILLDKIDRRRAPDARAEKDVLDILADVRQNADTALVDYTRRFDCPDFAPPLRIDPQTIRAARAAMRADDLAALRAAADNIRAFHQAQKQESWFLTRPDGALLGQKIDPVDRAGLYVPGGLGGDTPLVSTLLMTAIPAQIAGVADIAVVTPPRRDGTVSPYILAAACLLDIETVYRVGGAWAIAALAFGTPSIPAVDVIAGPGNIWVTTAKRLVQGRVGIDMLAGPSEVLILADAAANPDWIAADMLSQAEHDRLASAICLTTDAVLGQRVLTSLRTQCAALPRAALTEQALDDWGAVAVVPNLDEAVALANRIAPEHLQLMTADPWSLLPRIRHAGAVFMGHHTPEALGDYFAGPNHVLPTLGTARFASALSVQTFTKRTSIIAASPASSARSASCVARLARLEALEAHARSMECRAGEQ